MKVTVIDEHVGEGQFPTFQAGEAVYNLQTSDESTHWMSCTISGFDTYIPDTFVNNSILIRQYNPTELVTNKGEVLEIEEIVNEWLYGKNEKKVCGWIPAEKVVSISPK